MLTVPRVFAQADAVVAAAVLVVAVGIKRTLAAAAGLAVIQVMAGVEVFRAIRRAMLVLEEVQAVVAPLFVITD